MLPLEPEDEFYPERITYQFRENSLHNRRFEQRRRLKGLLGRSYRRLVEHATSRHISKTTFLRDLQEDETHRIRRVLAVEPGEFWRACRGKLFLDLQSRQVQPKLAFVRNRSAPPHFALRRVQFTESQAPAGAPQFLTSQPD